MAALVPALVAGLAVFGGYTYGPLIKRTSTVIGWSRTINNTPVAAGDITFIGDTVHCEDIHHHVPSGLLFTACEDDSGSRKAWFPPLGTMNDPAKANQFVGSIHIIDPKDMTTKRLEFEDYDGAFITHGIDVITDPENQNAVYIFAVNHVPHPIFVASRHENRPDHKVPIKANPRIEIFHHVIGSSTARHIRSVQDPLIKTPNDIYASDPRTFYVTNDHGYRDGFMRHLEDLWPGTTWSDTIQVRIDDLSAEAFADGVTAKVAHSGMRNNNGLGHYGPDKILIDDCAAGIMHIGQLPSGPENSTISILDSVYFDSPVDNPSWFDDPYRSEGHDASGFVLPGLANVVELAKNIKDPAADLSSIVWYAKPIPNCESTEKGACWEKRVLFEDDGQRISSAAGAVLVAIDPAKENGKRKAWLFISGFWAKSIVAVKVDL